MGADPPTADGPASVPATPDRPVAVAGPGITREGRRAIAVGAFLAIFVGSLLLLADGVGVLAKLALALPLVVVGLAAGLAVARPADGWTAGRDQRRVPAAAPVAAAPVRPPTDSTSIRRTPRPGVPRRQPAPAGRGLWYFLPLLPVCLLAVLLLAIDGDLFGPIKAGLLISTGVLTALVVVALVPRPRRAGATRPTRPPVGAGAAAPLR